MKVLYSSLATHFYTKKDLLVGDFVLTLFEYCSNILKNKSNTWHELVLCERRKVASTGAAGKPDSNLSSISENANLDYI